MTSGTSSRLSGPDGADGDRPKRRSVGSVLFRIVRLVLVVCLLLLLVVYLLLLLFLMIFEESLIFVPSSYPWGDWQPTGVSFEDAEFEAADGTRLHGWYAHRENARAVVLFCHGNAGNVTHRAHTLAALHDLAGVSVLIFDYRGYGKSDGKPNEEGVLADGRAARAWLAEKAGIAQSDVVLMGRSLGGAVAVDMAAKDGARALVLESTFSSVPDVAAYHYPWIPVRWVLRTRLDAAAKIGEYRGPLLVSHGDADRVVPYSLGQKLFGAASEPKSFFTIPGGDHNDVQPRDYYVALVEFLDDLPPIGP